VLVASIDPGSPAEVAGLKAGDIIMSIDRRTVSARFVEELPAFYSRIAHIKPGTGITLSVQRNGELLSTAVTTARLGELQGEDFEVKGWGFTVKAITQQMQLENTLEDTVGVYVAGVKRTGPAGSGGLRPGDVIVKVNQADVSGLGDFITLYQGLRATGEEKILLTVGRTGSTRYVLLKPDAKEEEFSHE